MVLTECKQDIVEIVHSGMTIYIIGPNLNNGIHIILECLSYLFFFDVSNDGTHSCLSVVSSVIPYTNPS